MIQLLRWLLMSGIVAGIIRMGTRRLAQRSDHWLMWTSTVLLGAGWCIIIGDSFLPVMAAFPVGLIAFLVTIVVSIATNVAAVLLAINLIMRRVRPKLAPASDSSGVIGTLIILLAAASFIAERIIHLIAAVNG